MDGDVIGMNFYDRKIATPFLYWKDIRGILALFEKKRYSTASYIHSFQHFKKFVVAGWVEPLFVVFDNDGRILRIAKDGKETLNM